MTYSTFYSEAPPPYPHGSHPQDVTSSTASTSFPSSSPRSSVPPPPPPYSQYPERPCSDESEEQWRAREREREPLLPSYRRRASSGVTVAILDVRTTFLATTVRSSSLASRRRPDHRPVLLKRSLRRMWKKMVCSHVCTFILRILLCLGLGAGLIYLWWDLNAEQNQEMEVLRVAVVGAGPSGVAAAWGLSSWREKGRKIEIVVFERKGGVGGRLVVDDTRSDVGRDVSIDGTSLGAGLQMEDMATAELNWPGSSLNRRAKDVLGANLGNVLGARDRRVGFWPGTKEKMVAEAVRPSKDRSWTQYLALIWRYGRSVWKAEELIATSSISEKLMPENGGYQLVEQILDASGLQEMMLTSGQILLQDHGIGDRYRDEIIRPQLRRQLGGQELEEMSALTVSRALLWENSPRHRYGHSDFQSILEQFLQESGAEVRLNTHVTGLKRSPMDNMTETWLVQSHKEEAALNEQMNEDRNPSYEAFDHVILSGSWNMTGLIPQLHEKEFEWGEEIEYSSLWTTFVLTDGPLSSTNFDGRESWPDEILPLSGDVFEISHLREVFGSHLSSTSDSNVTAASVSHLYRIMSGNPLNDTMLSSLFESGNMTTVKKEIRSASPSLYPRASTEMGRFGIGEGLWQTGIMDEVGTGMDLAWWAGENVAELVKQRIAE